MTQDSSIFWKKSRVELRAAGFDPDRAAHTSAVVTIAAAWTNAHRCNNRVRGIADLLVELLAERGGQGLVVGAPAVSDALTQGTPTAGYSLVSRDVVADCFEIGHYAHHGDAMIVISGCDKTGAAALMPLARTNAFGLVLYPGTSSPGSVSFEPWASKGSNLTIMDYAEARAAHEAGRISTEELPRHRAQRDAGQRNLWCHVHREHDERDRRGDRHDAAARRFASGRLPGGQRHPRRRARTGPRVGRSAVPADRRRHPAAGHHDRARLRERDRDGLRDGRFDQHVPAPAGDRARGPGAAHDRAHPAGRRADPADRQPAAPRPVCDGGAARARRRANRDEGVAAPRPAAWRRDDGHRQDAGREPRGRADARGSRPAGRGLPGGRPDRAAEQPHQRAQGQPRTRELPAEALRQDAGEGPRSAARRACSSRRPTR